MTYSCWWINYNRFGIFRRALHAEMKNATKGGLHTKQEDEKPLSSLFNAAFHEETFQNCNFHVVNNFSKYDSE